MGEYEKFVIRQTISYLSKECLQKVISIFDGLVLNY